MPPRGGIPVQQATPAWLAASLAVACLVMVACGGEPQPPTGTATDETPSGIPSYTTQQGRADAQTLVALVEASVESQPLDGAGYYPAERFVPKPRPVPAPTARWTPPPEFFAKTPGDIVTTLGQSAPAGLLIDDDGTVLVSDDLGLRIFPVQGMPRRHEDLANMALHWNADGSLLAASSPESKMVATWPGLERDDLSGMGLVGVLVFAPDSGPEGNTLWAIGSSVAWDARVAERVRFEVTRVDRGARAAEPLRPRPGAIDPLAALGTFPALGMAWGSPAVPHLILPDPAPIMELDGIHRLERLLTDPGQQVDVAPVAPGIGEVFFIRAERVGDAGLGASARAWVTQVNTPTTARPLTAEPTARIAVSPGGAWTALAIVRDGRLELLRTRTDQLFRDAVVEAETARGDFRGRAQRVADDMAAELARTGPGATLEAGEYGPILGESPGQEDLRSLATAFRRSVDEHLGIELPQGLDGLAVMDDLLRFLDGVWDEHPANVAAVAALYGEALAGHGGVEWFLDGTDPELSASASETTSVPPGSRLFAFHLPYYVAREALAGKLSLVAEADSLLRRPERPIALVESFQTSTALAFVLESASRGGIDPAEATYPELMAAAAANPSNGPLLLLALAGASERSDDPAAAWAALQLALRSPTNPRALQMAATALENIGAPDLACELMARAEKLDPGDPVLLLQSADAHLIADRLDAARERYQFLVDSLGEGHPALETARERLQDTRGETATKEAQ